MKRGNLLVQALCEVHERPLDVLGWFAWKPYLDALIALLHHGGPPSFPDARSTQLWTRCGSFHRDLTLPGTNLRRPPEGQVRSELHQVLAVLEGGVGGGEGGRLGALDGQVGAAAQRAEGLFV
jgi:hypothetical protein